MATQIKKRPDGKVAKMTAPKRESGYNMKTTWQYAKAVVSEKSDKRATKVMIRTMLDCRVSGKFNRLTQDIVTSGSDGNLPKEVTRNINYFTIGQRTWTRADFYPVTKRRLLKVWTHVALANDKGRGEWQGTHSEFKPPRKPSISAITQGKDDGTLRCTIDTNAGADLYERYDTYYTTEYYNPLNETKTVKNEGSGRGTSIPLSINVASRLRISYDQYIRWTVKAYARGFAGDSETVSRSYYISWPPLPVVTGVYIPQSKEPSDKVTVMVRLRKLAKDGKSWDDKFNEQHPVTGVRLEILRNSEVTTSTEAAAVPSSEWTPMDYEDDGGCVALAATVTDVIPERGLHTWVRIKSWNDIEEIFYRYSAPVEVKALYTAPPGQSESGIAILNAESGDDGESAVLTIGWNASGQDTMTGTEVSWAESLTTWRSTTAPQVHEFTWSDGSLTYDDTTYNDSAVIHVMGLKSGTTYHFKARRYQDRDTGDRLYGAYSQNDMIAIPASSPTSVSLRAAGSVAEGRPLEITWAYDSEATQTAYEVIHGTIRTETDPEGRQTRWIATSGTGILYSGSDARGSYVIPADVLQAHATDGVINIAVRVSTGGGFVESEASTVTINQTPEAGIEVQTVTAQGASMTVTSTTPTASATVTVTAQGSGGDMPDGTVAQVGGDVVWSETVAPEWTLSDGVYSGTIQLPENATLYDDASYTVTLTLTDTVTGLVSEPVTDEFTVAWAHQAPEPSDQIQVVGHDETDMDGRRTIYATITLQEPTGAAADDVYDVYRILDDEVQLIAESRELESVVTDNFAPFGNRTLAYRVACRTADGDVDWEDYEYELAPRPVTDGLMMRIDYGQSYVELERGVSYSDRRSKAFVGRVHKDEMTQRGYWDDQITRGGQSSAAAIMVYEQDVMEALDELAVYRGACFVRLSTGVAYEANVDVSGPNMRVGSAGASYSLSFSKIALTPEHMAVPVEASEQAGGE